MIRIGGKIAGGTRIASKIVAGVRIGGNVLLFGGPAPFHTFSIVVGSRSDVRGWWDGRAGSITDGSYTLSDGSNGRIRQFMRSTTGVSIPSGRIRFLFNGNRAANLFPDRIIARNCLLYTSPSPRDS